MKEKEIQSIRDEAYALTNHIIEIQQTYKENMGHEIIQYLKEKLGVE